MSLQKEGYIKRLIDEKIDTYLSVFGAISIEGPKWCGKTWSAYNHANSAILMDQVENQEKAKVNIELVLNGENPELIDEWNLIPEIWDAVRRKCDEDGNKGKYILTCSTKLRSDVENERIFHSGAGRIGRVKMRTMSLYETGESTGKVSIMDMYNGKLKPESNKLVSLEELAVYIVRGGWPSNLNTDLKNIGIIPKNYIEAILEKDINTDRNREKGKMLMLLKSLARNEATIVNKNTILKDIEENSKEETIDSRTTIDDYLDVLERLNIVDNQEAYKENYRSPERIGKAAKRHFTDPSLACACLNLTVDKLMNDLRTFGLLFEALVERDLRVYMDYLNGKVYHFRDNVSGLEVDSILEFEDGEYAAVEVKLGFNQYKEAIENLLRFYKNMEKKPKFMCVVVGFGDVIAQDPETGIYIVPLTALKP